MRHHRASPEQQNKGRWTRSSIRGHHGLSRITGHFPGPPIPTWRPLPRPSNPLSHPRRPLFYEPFQPLRDRVRRDGVNLNHPTRRGNKPSAGKRSQFSIQGRKVGAAQAPARTHSVPSPADSPFSNTPNCARKQSNSKPKKIKGLADSPGNSLRKRLFYGQVDPTAHS